MIKYIESQVRMPFMSLPIKMTLVTFDDAVILISPVPLIENFKNEIDSFGEVTDIVAPNCFHNLGIMGAIKAYPNAKVWIVEGIEKKKKDLEVYNFITESNWPYMDKLPFVAIEGMPNVNEIVFLHERTLIVTDLCFNHINGKGIGNWIIFNLFGTYKKFAISKFFLNYVKDEAKFKKSIDRILNLEFDKILIPHGVNVPENGKKLLRDALKERSILS